MPAVPSADRWGKEGIKNNREELFAKYLVVLSHLFSAHLFLESVDTTVVLLIYVLC